MGRILLMQQQQMSMMSDDSMIFRLIDGGCWGLHCGSDRCIWHRRSVSLWWRLWILTRLLVFLFLLMTVICIIKAPFAVWKPAALGPLSSWGPDYSSNKHQVSAVMKNSLSLSIHSAVYSPHQWISQLIILVIRLLAVRSTRWMFWRCWFTEPLLLYMLKNRSRGLMKTSVVNRQMFIQKLQLRLMLRSIKTLQCGRITEMSNIHPARLQSKVFIAALSMKKPTLFSCDKIRKWLLQAASWRRSNCKSSSC